METPNFLSAILDTLDCQVAVIDGSGSIRYVNQAWHDFAEENGMAPGHRWIGTNYLNVCNTAATLGDRDGAHAFSGIRSVLDSESSSFCYEYPCHSDDRQRWFMMRIAGLKGTPGLFVISHQIITERKLAEQKIESENQELALLASTDNLTRLANRMKLDKSLDTEIYRAKRYAVNLSIILLDIDHFKKVNDNFGHQAGDEVLMGLAEVLRSNLRESDLAGRWGGEEFLVILAECDIEAATHMAEKLRIAVAAHEFPNIGLQTCSFGVTCYKPGHDASTLIACADSALYRAKDRGRNCVEVTYSGCSICMEYANKLGQVAIKAASVCDTKEACPEALRCRA